MPKELLRVLYRLLRVALQKKIQVQFLDTARTSPVSSCFGFDRGTPVDRYYIENFFRANGRTIRGKVLEVGDSTYGKRFSRGGVESFHVLQHAALGTDPTAIVGDLADVSTLPADAFDCFICAQTFQYTFELSKAVAGAYHLLRPGGVLLATVPGISQISRYDADRYGEYWRFTADSVARLFHPVFDGGVEIAAFGNVLSSTLFLQGIALEELPDVSLLDVHDRDYPMIVTVVARKAR